MIALITSIMFERPPRSAFRGMSFPAVRGSREDHERPIADLIGLLGKVNPNVYPA
jgi:hypothetical protein